MGQYAVEVHNVSKQYMIGQLEKTEINDLRQAMMNVLLTPVRRARSLLSGEAYGALDSHESIWALKDVSFNVKEGEVVGIIGKNGAGKSTLLKILSRITKPTEGNIRLQGRVGSLLEVGTGFHADLTGRENIYLNGAILGMPRSEIDKKFDEIVDFSGVEKFIDTPVKFYSSGMGLRLGFAVAAHLEPDILVVDEVLAVGDAEFQKKCIGKMSDVAGQGRTVLFVSHNMGAVQNLCSRAILLQQGTVMYNDITEKVIDQYLNSYKEAQGDHTDLTQITRTRDYFGTQLMLTNVYTLNSNGEETDLLDSDEGFSVIIEAQAKDDITDVSAIIGIDTVFGVRVATVTSEPKHPHYRASAGDMLRLEAKFAPMRLTSGGYGLTIGLRDTRRELYDHLHDAYRFEISQLNIGDVSDLNQRGYVRANTEWEKL